MCSKYKNIIFDLDGTITDSAKGVTRSIQYALKHFGIVTSFDELKVFVGPPLQLSFQKYFHFNEVKARKAVEYYREYYSKKGIFENKLYPLILEMLVKLFEKDSKLFVATSKPTVYAGKILKHFNIIKFFAAIAGSNLNDTRVEKCEVISYLLKQNKIDKNIPSVMVGDRKHDIEGAKINGLDSIAVSYGYGSMSELCASEPTYITHSVSELTKLLLS